MADKPRRAIDPQIFRADRDHPGLEGMPKNQAIEDNRRRWEAQNGGAPYEPVQVKPDVFKPLRDSNQETLKGLWDSVTQRAEDFKVWVQGKLMDDQQKTDALMGTQLPPDAVDKPLNWDQQHIQAMVTQSNMDPIVDEKGNPTVFNSPLGKGYTAPAQEVIPMPKTAPDQYSPARPAAPDNSPKGT